MQEDARPKLPNVDGSGYSARVARSSERIGEYRLVAEIARTPSAIVYEAEHLVLPRRALLKVIAAPTERLAVRALREPFLLETLQHPGIPRVYDSALLPDRRPWFARELVDGPTLAMRLGSRSGSRVDVIAFVRDVAETLAYAHSRGVVYAGLRPDRILLADRGRGFGVCLADWSDARTHDAAPVPYALSPGGWPYASPELVAGDAIDDRADVFALGAIAYEILTGVEPAPQHVPTEVRCADAPPELTGLVDQMLAFDRWDRPSAAEVCADLGWLVEVLASSQLRMRKPRWTPQIAMAAVEDDAYDELAIGDDHADT